MKRWINALMPPLLGLAISLTGIAQDREEPAPQTQASGDGQLFSGVDDYYVYVTTQAFNPPSSRREFLATLDEPIQESWQESIAMLWKTGGFGGRQEYVFASTRPGASGR